LPAVLDELAPVGDHAARVQDDVARARPEAGEVEGRRQAARHAEPLDLFQEVGDVGVVLAADHVPDVDAGAVGPFEELDPDRGQADLLGVDPDRRVAVEGLEREAAVGEAGLGVGAALLADAAAAHDLRGAERHRPRLP
jgi:hypothetical protein